MCGIAGIIDPRNPPNRQLLEAMAAPLAKRGPDDFGHVVHGPAGLAHRRLSVIDLAGGHQPLYNEDRTLALVFNGEIYDYGELRRRLIDNGHVLATESDSEVLLHLYEDKGPAMLDELNGMFAFAILHVDSGKVFIARDRFGQKPLFYSTAGDRFAFASGPASLAAVNWVDTTIDCSAIHDYLEYQYIPKPRSIYQGVAKLPPGHYAEWIAGNLTVNTYWRPEISPTFAGSYEEACAALRQNLAAAVERRLVADVPVGMFLSGGLDSSLICALANSVGTTQIKTFSIGFPEKKYDERVFAKTVADHLGTEHHFLEVAPNDFDHLERIVADYEEPFCDASMLPTSLLSQFTRQHVTVALSGDAADELFGGYYRYRAMNMSRWFGLVPRAVRRGAGGVLRKLLPTRKEERTMSGRLQRLLDISEEDGLDRYLRLISRCPAPLKNALYGERMKDAGLTPSVGVLTANDPVAPTSMLNRIMEVDLNTYLSDDILVKVDRASMACGLEVRSPFLDRDVVGLALSLPDHWKQKGMTRKRILADTFADLLPAEIMNRRKMGFGVPLARWFRGDWQARTRELLVDGKLASDGYFDRNRLQWLIDEHVAERADYSYAIYALLVLELWLSRR
jgi:asparagine synthase (glutamine-hydrolysing)